jgi:hypothetical protein
LAARRRKQGWNEDRIYNAKADLKQWQQRQEDKVPWSGKHFFELGGLDYNAVRFFKNLIKVRKFEFVFAEWLTFERESG